MAYGLLSTGFFPKPLETIRTEVEEDCRSAFGQGILVTDKSNWGQFIGLLSDRFSEVWQVMEALNSAFDPDKAEDYALIVLCALTGTVPRSPTPSSVVLTCTGTPGTVLADGRVASVSVVGTRFQASAGTIDAATAWTSSTHYNLNDRITNSGNIYLCTVAGTSASSGPSGSGTAINDGSITWRYLGAGTGFVRVTSQSIETGPKVGAAFTIVNIETPVAGWSNVVNEEDAVLGQNLETNTELRIRRENELLGASSSTLEAIRTRMFDVDDVFSVTVFENATESTVDGMPPHSVEVMVRGGDPQAIGEKVRKLIAAGITSFGNQTTTVVDVDNGEQTYSVGWSRPVEKPIYVIAHVVKDPNTYPQDGDTQISDSILATGQSYTNGKDVYSSALKSACFGYTKTLSDGTKTYVAIPGVIDVSALYIGLSPAPTSEASIPITLRELAIFNSINISVVSTNGVP
jgi:hypothetical protein